MSEYAIRALDATTWDAFARLAEKHKGGGVWLLVTRGSIRARAGPRARLATPRAASMNGPASATTGPRERTIA